ncbi:glycosyltransferase [Paenibacillus luteus]|uniref:glycosyltransferase n=1 Tax=Paenibacillus luteus TaxID=2545753 RepID=UPI001142DBB2|nr:glycosyltransferase [Paenibacillus luteus]
MEIVLWSVAALLSLQLVFAAWNVRQLPLFGQLGHSSGKLIPEEGVQLSVLIPARNEQGNIIECLQSIQRCLPANQSDKRIEVIILDDRSEDETARLVEQFSAEDQRFRLVRGLEKPDGWVGKAYACHQLSMQARGAWYLYVDADTRLRQSALETVLQAISGQAIGFISGFPEQQTGSWLEKLVVPMMGFTIACHLPIRLVSASSDPRFAAAHGGWIAISRATYEAAGGHEANAGQLVDDVALMRAVKRAGHPVVLADVRQQVSMRMYHNASEVWSGYKKNIFAGVGRSGLLLAAVLAIYVLLYLLPFMMLLVSPLYPALLPSALTGYLLGIAVKAVADRSQGQPWLLALFIPFSIGAVVAIGAASWLSAKFGTGYVWKGRMYE